MPRSASTIYHFRKQVVGNFDSIARGMIDAKVSMVPTGGPVDASQLAVESLGQHKFTTADAPVDGHIVRDSVRRFKGLDRPVVVLCSMETESDEDIAYVALTRAKSLLVVIGEAAVLDRLGRSSV